MYNPARFKVENVGEAFEFMAQFPFVTLVSVAEGAPMISHVPLVPKMVDGKIELIGHMARANPHGQILSAGSCTAIFLGSHSYVTPEWYVKHDVPTWNYSSLHARGVVEMIEEEAGVIQCLRTLSDHVEKLWPSGWKFFIPEDLAGPNLTRGIVGFKLAVEQINFKRKLGQNRSVEDIGGVIDGLATRDDDNSRGVRADMLKVCALK
jgi:transcriptional regulator